MLVFPQVETTTERSPSRVRLIFADQIFRGFTNAQDRVAVIVNLVPPSRARQATDWNSRHSLATLRAANRAAQGNVLKSLTASEHRVRYRFDNQASFSCEVTEKALQKLLDNPQVESIEPVQELRAHLAQGISLMNALASRPTYNGTNLAIAICDTGIDYTHPRLGGGSFPNSKVIGGYDFGNSDANPMSVGEAHGTACAGIAAGDLGTVGDYIGGVAPGAKLYALKISPDNSGSATDDAMIAAWDWCVTHKNDDPSNPIMVISTSFGGGQFFSNCDSDSPGMTAAASNAVAAGITVLASSGNDGYCDSMGWPACITSVISVGAVYDANFGTYYPCISSSSCAPKTFTTTGCSPYSQYYATDSTASDKVTSYSNVASFLGVFAPANQGYTLDILGSSGYSTGDYFDSFGGTSAACPYAAGAVACLQHAAKSLTGSYLTPAEVRNFLANYGDSITDTKVAITKPRVNLGNMINALVTDLRVTPVAGLGASGLVGGPFSPSNQTYAVSNATLSSLVWAASRSQAWISLSTTGGTLPTGGVTNVTVTINANATGLPAGNYVDTIVFTNLTTISGTTTRPVTLNVQVPVTTIFFADFEDGSGGHSADGFTYTTDPDASSNLWHGSTSRSVSPTHSQYYGLESAGNYNTGARNAGNLQSPSISLAGVVAPITLLFKHWLETENFSGYDVATVQVSTNAGTAWITLTTLGAAGTFTTFSSDISAHAGKNIHVRFNFDTIDDLNNSFEGWYVDDVTIQGAIANQPPAVTAASVVPGPDTFSDESLSLTGVVATDPETNAITLAYQWQFTTNGVAFADQAGATNAVLPAAPGNSGKLWRCRLTPSDPSGSGTNFLASPVAVNNRPNMLGRHNQFYSYDSDLFLAFSGGSGTFTRSALINEFSQGASGSKEWVEILFLKNSDARGWKLFDSNTATITFSSNTLWSNVVAGTLLVVYNGADRDTILPADDTNPADGMLVIAHSNTTYFSGSWIGLGTGGDFATLSDSASTLIDGVSYGSNSSQTPQLGSVGAATSANYTSNTETGVDVAVNWTIVASSSATPSLGNGTVNSNFVADIRSGAFNSTSPQFRFGISGDTVPGLSIDTTNGLVSGIINAPAGGFYNVVIERYAGTNVASQQYNLLVGNSNDVYTIPTGKTWAINTNYTIPGTLVVQGLLDTAGHTLVVSNTLDVSSGTVSNVTGLIVYHKLIGGPLPGATSQFNTLPVISAASVSPASPVDTDNLVANVTGASDADGDAITFAYQWQESSNSIAFTSATLTNTATAQGLFYRCVITPNDGIANGAPFITVAVQIALDLQILSLQPSNTDFVITYSGVSNNTYELQSATDLVLSNWIGIATNVAGSTGPADFIDVGATSQTQKFYRIRLLP